MPTAEVPDATAVARATISALLEAGVREFVICAGSRNAPLSFAAHAAAASGQARVQTRLDERTAGFVAVGLTKVHARAAVITTSGTAVANLAPAAWEAAHAGVPVVFVTADRPARLRGTHANQTADQVGSLGLGTLDLAEVAEAEGLGPRLREADALGVPLHLNVQLDGALMPAEPWAVPTFPEVAWSAPAPPPETLLALGPRTVVVAGDDAGPGARQLAEAADWPLCAEPSSGARAGAHALQAYRLLLDSPLGHEIERVVVWGHPTLSRPVARLLARTEVVAVPARGKWPARPHPVHQEVVRPAVALADDGTWLERWRAADAAAVRHLTRVLDQQAELTPYVVAAAVNAALPPDGLLVVGASSPIRDLDLMAPPRVVGQRRLTLANRGLAGIDGTLSTAIGAALGRRHTSRALALMGDLTFLHDTTALFLGPAEPVPDLTVVVVNDNGGSIFAMLEQGAPEYADSYEALFGMPHGVNLEALCAAARIPHLRVTSLPELQQALGSPNGGLEVVEAVVRRDNRRALDAALRELPSAEH